MRLDDLVAERAGVTRSHARGLILAGRVSVDGAPATKAGAKVRKDAALEVERPRPYVSRGGEKLEYALRSFEIDVLGKRALDIGASTGGFTDCLLKAGASHVSAVDVGYGQLAWELRNDPRVKVVERTNFRFVAADALGPLFDVIVVDASFISLRTIVARARLFLAEAGVMVALVKPQFEAGRERVSRGGVVRDPEVHASVLREVRDSMRDLGFSTVSLVASPLIGPAGNREFFFALKRSGPIIDDQMIARIAQPVGQ